VPESRCFGRFGTQQGPTIFGPRLKPARTQGDRIEKNRELAEAPELAVGLCQRRRTCYCASYMFELSLE
jgi:hypothetical protein